MTATDTPLQRALESFVADGYTGELLARPDSEIMCVACRGTFAAADFEPSAQHRVEGASDPAEMQLIVGGVCLACGTPSVLTLSYGPMASAVDQDVLVELTLDDESAPVATQSGAEGAE